VVLDAPRGVLSEAEGHLVGGVWRALFALGLAEDFVGVGEDGGWVDARGFGDAVDDLIQGVAGVFELEVDRIVVVAAVVLQAFHEVSGEVAAVVLGVAVALDLLDFAQQEPVVVGGGDAQSVAVEPGRRPGEREQEGAAVALVIAVASGVIASQTTLPPCLPNY